MKCAIVLIISHLLSAKKLQSEDSMKKIACTIVLVIMCISVYAMCKTTTPTGGVIMKIIIWMLCLAAGVAIACSQFSILGLMIMLPIAMHLIFLKLNKVRSGWHVTFFMAAAVMACSFGEPIAMSEIFRNASLMGLFGFLAYLTREKPPAPIRFKDGIGVH